MFRLSNTADYKALNDSEWCFTAIKDKNVIACGGLLPVWPNNTTRAMAWMLLANDLGPNFTFIHRAVLKVLNDSPFDRVEAHIDPKFPPAERWIRMLGFRIETPWKPFFFPDGSAAQEWIRIS